MSEATSKGLVNALYKANLRHVVTTYIGIVGAFWSPSDAQEFSDIMRKKVSNVRVVELKEEEK